MFNREKAPIALKSAQLSLHDIPTKLQLVSPLDLISRQTNQSKKVIADHQINNNDTNNNNNNNNTNTVSNFFDALPTSPQLQALPPQSQLALAVYAGNYDHVRDLLQNKEVKVNIPLQAPGVTPLIYASERGHQNIVELLIEKKALPSYFQNSNSFLFACSQGHLKTVKYLLQKGVDASAPYLVDMRTPLLEVLIAGQTTIFDYLWGVYNRDIKLPSLIENTNGQILNNVDHNGNIIIDLDIEGVDNDNKTVIHYAVVSGQLPLVQRVIDLTVGRIHLDTTTTLDGRSPLHYATQLRFYDIVSFLLSLGCNQHLAAKDGLTPFQIATTMRDQRLLTLFEYGITAFSHYQNTQHQFVSSRPIPVTSHQLLPALIPVEQVSSSSSFSINEESSEESRNTKPDQQQQQQQQQAGTMSKSSSPNDQNNINKSQQQKQHRPNRKQSIFSTIFSSNNKFDTDDASQITSPTAHTTAATSTVGSATDADHVDDNDDGYDGENNNIDCLLPNNGRLVLEYSHSSSQSRSLNDYPHASLTPVAGAVANSKNVSNSTNTSTTTTTYNNNNTIGDISNSNFKNPVHSMRVNTARQQREQQQQSIMTTPHSKRPVPAPSGQFAAFNPNPSVSNNAPTTTVSNSTQSLQLQLITPSTSTQHSNSTNSRLVQPSTPTNNGGVTTHGITGPTAINSTTTLTVDKSNITTRLTKLDISDTYNTTSPNNMSAKGTDVPTPRCLLFDSNNEQYQNSSILSVSTMKQHTHGSNAMIVNRSHRAPSTVDSTILSGGLIHDDSFSRSGSNLQQQLSSPNSQLGPQPIIIQAPLHPNIIQQQQLKERELLLNTNNITSPFSTLSSSSSTSITGVGSPLVINTRARPVPPLDRQCTGTGYEGRLSSTVPAPTTPSSTVSNSNVSSRRPSRPSTARAPQPSSANSNGSLEIATNPTSIFSNHHVASPNTTTLPNSNILPVTTSSTQSTLITHPPLQHPSTPSVTRPSRPSLASRPATLTAAQSSLLMAGTPSVETLDEDSVPPSLLSPPPAISRQSSTVTSPGPKQTIPQRPKRDPSTGALLRNREYLAPPTTTSAIATSTTPMTNHTSTNKTAQPATLTGSVTTTAAVQSHVPAAKVQSVNRQEGTVIQTASPHVNNNNNELKPDPVRPRRPTVVHDVKPSIVVKESPLQQLAE